MDDPFLFLGGLGGWEILIIVIFVLAGTALWLYTLVDILRSRFRNDSDKIVWVLVVILLQFLGAIIYLAMGRNQKIA
ncbi:MAG: PLD nuclease N-terminal domain-containing protein [Bacteroidota bacterium]